MEMEPEAFYAIHITYNPWLVAIAASPFALGPLALGSRFFVSGSRLAVISLHLFIASCGRYYESA